MKKQGNMTPLKENNNFLVIDSKENEIQKMPKKEFKIIILRKPGEIQKKIGK